MAQSNSPTPLTQSQFAIGTLNDLGVKNPGSNSIAFLETIANQESPAAFELGYNNPYSLESNPVGVMSAGGMPTAPQIQTYSSPTAGEQASAGFFSHWDPLLTIGLKQNAPASYYESGSPAGNELIGGWNTDSISALNPQFTPNTSSTLSNNFPNANNPNPAPAQPGGTSAHIGASGSSGFPSSTGSGGSTNPAVASGSGTCSHSLSIPLAGSVCMDGVIEVAIGIGFVLLALVIFGVGGLSLIGGSK